VSTSQQLYAFLLGTHLRIHTVAAAAVIIAAPGLRRLFLRRLDFEPGGRRTQCSAAFSARWEMTGPRPAGRPWTPEEDDQLRSMLDAGTKTGLIARELTRSLGAIYARANEVRKTAKTEKAVERIQASTDRLNP
jgi:hypothetical protein